MPSSEIVINFHGNLPEILPKKLIDDNPVTLFLNRTTSVKDLIESCNIPHPEVETICFNRIEVNWDFLINQNGLIDVYPISPQTNFYQPSLLRPIPLKSYRFIVDINIAKLAVKLRQLGYDTLLPRNSDDGVLAAISACQRRILLTRDIGLLKRKIVEFGHLVRALKPDEQLVEVVRLFRLKEKMNPNSRCLLCNGILAAIAKKEIEHLLEPLTKKYYNNFTRCQDCGKIYWSGSHRKKMDDIMQKVLTTC